MNTKSFAIIAGVLAVSAANAVTFTAGGPSSAPTFVNNATTTVLSASTVGNSYVVNALPITLNPVGANFGWDFYATADPGKWITGVTFTLTFTGTLTGTYYQTTTAAYKVSGNAEYYSADSVSSGSPIPNTLSQGVSVPGKFSKYHFFVSDSFYIPAGSQVTAVTAVVNEAVPEPASIAAIAIGGLGLLRRRRKA